MKKTRIVGLLLVFVLVTSCFVGGTFAKYASKATGSDTATVARWAITVGGDGNNNVEIAQTTQQTISFKLFDTVEDTFNPNGTDDANVHGTSNLIAPGTWGSFKLSVTNNAEVNAQYTIELKETNGAADLHIPLQYSVDNKNWKDSVEELVMSALTDVQLEMGNSSEKTVYWRWAFNDKETAVTDGSAHAGQTNETDTKLGITAQGAAPTVTIEATITVEQVD